MTNLDKLIDAVERGGTDAWHGCGDILGVERGIDCHVAYSGSLDAAKALHDALLPGWGWMLGDKGSATVIPPERLAARGVIGVTKRIDNQNARAWLIAILKAYRSQVQG